MSKHTPGPWYLDEVSADDWQVNSDLHDHCLFQITPTIGVQSLTEEDKANAQLIAAAPDMLEALQSLIVCDFGANGWTETAEQAAIKARTAVLKATGEKK